MQLLLQKTEVYKHGLSMLNFGGPTLKPTWLWSNRPCLSKISDYVIPESSAPREALVQTWENAGGQRKFRGNSKTKGSQEYPPAFGEAVASLYDSCDSALKRWAARGRIRAAERASVGDDLELITVVSEVRGGWEDADLEEVFALLGSQRFVQTSSSASTSA